jgi:HPr kinase/phosphorylase
MEPDQQQQALERLRESGLACVIVSDGEQPPPAIRRFAESRKVPVIASPLPSLQIIWVVRTYLGRALAEFVTRHGVLLDVLGMGVLLTGDSGVGKSELALELITRGGGLVADDVVELYHVAPETLEGRSPELLKEFLEVRGLGMLNIRTIFGETAVRVRKNLKIIVQLEKPVGGVVPGLERLPLEASTEEILGVRIRKVVLPVAAGRNLAVLVEAAVRNYVLQLRGIDSTQEFIRRQEQHFGRGT